MKSLTTDRGDAGKRLDLVLRRHLADVEIATRTRVQGWIERGCVTVDGACVRRVAARVAPGATVTVMLPDAAPRAPTAAESAILDVLYEDDHLLAVNKPPGIVVHPTHGHRHGTLLNALVWHARDWSPAERPSLVGRLDKLTSGIVLVARTAAGHTALQRAARHGEKDYLAVVYGRVKEAQGRIDLRLARDTRDRRRVVASPGSGAPSVTLFERLARVAAPRCGLSLLRCRLVTGRTHQIRVHLAARGWPVVGDPTYGEPRLSAISDAAIANAVGAFPRQALHAWRVALVHPMTGQRVHIEAPVPDDLRRLLEATGLNDERRLALPT